MNARFLSSLLLVALLSICWSGVVAAAEKKDDDTSKAQDRFRTSALRPSDGYLVDWEVMGPFHWSNCQLGSGVAVRVTLCSS